MTDTATTSQQPIIWWLRRDLRLTDNPALTAVAESGRPVVPLYIFDPAEERLGAAPKFRLGLGLQKLQQSLAAKGLKLILRKGNALTVLRDVLRTCDGAGVYWSRLYDPQAIKRDTAVKTALQEDGFEARSFAGHLMFEPWTVKKKTGGMFQVYTPFWKAVSPRDIGASLPAPQRLRAAEGDIATDSLADFEMAREMRRGAAIVASHCVVGEDAAWARAEQFLHERLSTYGAGRNHPAVNATSGLSENLAWGEISPRQIWNLGRLVEVANGIKAEQYFKELVWREFAYHLMYHTPHILKRNWRDQWDGFPWSEEETAALRAWQRGQTGIDLVDAGMRELYVTGTMHNRVRMVVASFLCKHLRQHWRQGMAWFEDCLIDWDPASNAMGWQWVAGCGPDAAPFFRIFNPDGQREKFDADHEYCHRWLAEGRAAPSKTALQFFDACPKAWTMTASDRRTAPIVDLRVGRQAALNAYEVLRGKAKQT